jgi:hypothetical protein
VALDTPSKRRSSVGVLASWLLAPPSPTDTAGVIDQADREHIAWTYSGILAAASGGVVSGPARRLLLLLGVGF